MKFSKTEIWSILKPFALKQDNLVRLGSEHDGGYLIPKNIFLKTDYLVSLGIKDDWNFEIEYLDYCKNAKVEAFDLTASSVYFVKRILSSLRRLDFTNLKKNLSIFFKFWWDLKLNKRVTYNNIGISENRKGYRSLSGVLSKLSDKRVLLKSDIEGGEYDVIKTICEYSGIIDILAIEFHTVLSDQSLFVSSLKKILVDFKVIHVHMNNNTRFDESLMLSDVVEVIFISKRFNAEIESQESICLPLENDSPCNPILPEYEIFI